MPAALVLSDYGCFPARCQPKSIHKRVDTSDGVLTVAVFAGRIRPMARSNPTRARVDQRRCGAIGLCVREAPELFRFQVGSKRATVDAAQIPGFLERKVLSLAERCPYRAILVEDAGTTAPG